MTLLARIQARMCSRCARQERFPGLEVCRDCAERLVAPSAKVPEWRRRLTAKDMTDAA